MTPTTNLQIEIGPIFNNTHSISEYTSEAFMVSIRKHSKEKTQKKTLHAQCEEIFFAFIRIIQLFLHNLGIDQKHIVYRNTNCSALNSPSPGWRLQLLIVG